MKKRFYNAVYSKAKQQRPTGTEKTNKKTSKNKTEKRNRQTNPQERETKSLFCGKPIFVARTNENSPVRFGTIKEGVKKPHRAGQQTNVANWNGLKTCF